MRSFCTVLVIIGALLLPWPTCKHDKRHTPALRMVAGQGLSVSQELLGAGEAATATQLELFEDSLAIALTGGRGRGGRGGSGNLGAASFSDVAQLQQLQTGIQYIAGSPTIFPSCEHNRSKSAKDNTRKPFCNNFIPRKPRDQQFCATCVSQSVATAMQMAVAAALENDVNNWEVNAASLYYCTDGGAAAALDTTYRTTCTMWMPELIRPTKSACLNNTQARALVDVAGEASVPSWREVCDSAKQSKDCPSQQNPWLRCTYKSLSTFWEIQQHIRNHGAVVTRLTIYDDFDVQFGPDARLVPGEMLKPYSYNKTAKPVYGHAAVIVGYDNDNYTWTLMNSWGSGNDTNSRSKGITADGLFKIQMGRAGVGVPDKTYGVACRPLAGSKWDKNGVKQFYDYRPRKPVELINPAKAKKMGSNVPCYNYRFTDKDTVASVVDAFAVDMQAFVEHQLTLPATQRAPEWRYQNVSYKLTGTPTTAELDKILTSASEVLRGKFQPYIQCSHYDRDGKLSNVTCNLSTGASVCNQLGYGTVGCTVYYSTVEVPLQLRVNATVQVCGIRFPYLAKPRESQAMALRTLNTECSDGAQNNGPYVACDKEGYVTYIWSDYLGKQMPPAFDFISHYDLDRPLQIPGFTPEVTDALLTLSRLQGLSINVTGTLAGTLPLQLSALTNLKHLLITYTCLTGSLPSEWTWPKMSSLLVGAIKPDFTYVKMENDCGITGPLPREWPIQMKNYKLLLLTNNKLSGSLPLSYTQSRRSHQVRLDGNQLTGSIPPAIFDWRVTELRLDFNSLSGSLPFTNTSGTNLERTLCRLNLTNNELTGELPSSWQRFSNLQTLDVSYNMLRGPVPLTWARFPSLGTLKLDGNAQLQGCVPIGANPSVKLSVTSAGTGITGRCNNIQSNEVEVQQRQALNLLPQLYIAYTRNWADRVASQLSQYASLQDMYGTPSQATKVIRFPKDAFADEEAFGITLQGIDGAIYVTRLTSEAVVVNMTVLMQLLPQLPQLRGFESDSVGFGWSNREKPASTLPANLPLAAPSSLKVFSLGGNNFTGSLPVAWQSWRTIETVIIRYNRQLSGSLPAWQGMTALRELDLQNNNLSGPLPAAYGEASWAKQLTRLDLRNNSRLAGTVPAMWASLTAQIYLYGINITGCLPDQLINRIFLNDEATYTPCSAALDNPDVAALQAVKGAFQGSGIDFSSWIGENQTTDQPVTEAPPYPAPYYCRKWKGVSCDQANQVSKVDISSLVAAGTSPQPTALSAAFMEALSGLTGLQVLNLSGCNMQGVVPESLRRLAMLKHLNISSNPGVNGSLPNSWATLSNLEILDVSACSITGSIPSTYGALQRLREFHVAARADHPGVTGHLPSTFGLMANLQVLDISDASVTGQLPAAWFDSTARQAAAAAAAALSKDLVAAMAAPTAVIGLTGLQVLRLGGNTLSGTIPDSIELLTQLRVLDLAGNRIQGSVPAKMATLLQLQELKLANNQLQGTLLQSFTRLTKLRVLDLSQNDLSGALPDLLVSLTELQSLNLASNLLNGTFPLIWGSMSTAATHKLSLIDLRDNPCMDTNSVNAAIAESGIEQNGRVQVLRGAFEGRNKVCSTPQQPV